MEIQLNNFWRKKSNFNNTHKWKNKVDETFFQDFFEKDKSQIFNEVRGVDVVEYVCHCVLHENAEKSF